ncbi:PREDICTED: 46 kDa FK506-binding nuclear protein-like isoform X2 [Priapulus caudatus]|uniref:FK506-binding protein n=1 Tax=Priapulus caudatus TaxID=37621 RepID=A0ABM1EZX1_PRICU|nr:PREDICTED: 46 kDa FK506-binding nuclear protein-like isoform X2 [Priapulus caudatus]
MIHDTRQVTITMIHALSLIQFQGVTLDGGKRYTQTVEHSFHISMAALERNSHHYGDVKHQEPVSLMVQHDKAEFLLCTLSHNKIPQQPLNLSFTEGEEVTFFLEGKGTIHLTGYILIEEDDFMSEEESSAEEIPELQAIGDGPHLKEITEEEAALISKQIAGKKRKRQDADLSVKKEQEKMTNKSEEKKKKKKKIIEPQDSDSDSGEESSLPTSDDEDDSEEENEKDASLRLPAVRPAGSFDDQLSDDDSTGSYIPFESKRMAKGEKKQIVSEKKKKEKTKNTPKLDAKVKTVQEQSEKKKKKKKTSQELVNGDDEKKMKQTASFRAVTLPSGTSYTDVVTGKGPEAKHGKFVHVYYKGQLAQNKKEFDSCLTGKPFKFRLGSGEVIKGWDQGLLGMKQGGKRTLKIPAKEAYGNQRMGTIPPSSTLLFDVELRAVS